MLGKVLENHLLFDFLNLLYLLIVHFLLPPEAGSSDPEKESVLYSNRAACHLKDGNCTDCIKDCTS